jgi:hypothetical protein
VHQRWNGPARRPRMPAAGNAQWQRIASKIETRSCDKAGGRRTLAPVTGARLCVTDVEVRASSTIGVTAVDSRLIRTNSAVFL